MNVPTEGAGSAGSAADEPVEVLGPDGVVAGVVPRHRIRAEGLAHRATFVVTVMAAPSAGPAQIAEPAASENNGGSLSDRVEEWLAVSSWPLVDSGTPPEMAPLSLGRPVSMSPDSPLVVHRRADWKDVYPGYWDLAFGGVCSVGERWLESAERELAEEAGLVTASAPADDPTAASPVTVIPLGAGRYRDEHSDVFGAIFVAQADREPQPADGEVVAVDVVPLRDLAAWTEAHNVCPDSAALVIPAVMALMSASGEGRPR